MEITFQKRISEEQKALINKFIVFCSSCLFKQEEIDQLKIHVKVNKTLQDAALCSAYIDCDNSFILTIAQWIFTSLPEKDSEWYLFETIAHEFAHIWQYYHKLLSIEDYGAIYRGKHYGTSVYNSPYISDIIELPWETEAFTIQNILKDLWLFNKEPSFIWRT